MLQTQMLLFATGILVFELLPLILAGNSTLNNSECILTDIESRLGIASQIIETARQKIPSDLKELCKKTLDHPECKNETYYVKPADCSDIYRAGELRDGLYDIWPQSRMSCGPLRVYCDMESNDGGWTVLQRRGDYQSKEDYFYRDYKSYQAGFGDLMKDFWIGNDNIFALTNQRPYQLRVNLSDWEGNSTYAIYDEFWIADELHNYTVHVKGYRGTAGDYLNTGYGFFTKDKDNDEKCADKRKGAWWYRGCSNANLNGLYLKGETKQWAEGVFWSGFRGPNYSLMDTVMKIRPTGFDVKAAE